MRSMRFAALSAVAALATLTTSCAAFSDDSGGDETTVVAAFYPLAWVSERIAEGTDTGVVLLTQPGTEPHDLELGVQQTADVVAADLVVFQSGFQPAVDDTVEQNADGAVLDVTGVVDLLAAEESHEDHAEHAEHTDGGDDDGHDHDHGDVDPHFWQDPIRVAAAGDAVAGELADLDPDNADTYRANAAALREDLVSLDEAYATGLADCVRDTIVVSHDAFGYLEKYGVHLASIVGLTPDAEPTAAVLGDLQNLIREEGITTVFSEPLKPALGEDLAADLDLTNGVLDPIEGLSSDTSGEDYLSLMTANLEAITAANGCR